MLHNPSFFCFCFFPDFAKRLLQSGGQLLSKHLTHWIPNYKVTEGNDTLQLVPFLATLWAQSCGPAPPPPHGCRRWQDFLPTLTFRTGYPFPQGGVLEPLKKTPGFSQHNSKLKLYIFFSFFLRKIMSKHCLNSHFKSNYYRFKTFIMLSLEPGKGYSCGTSGQKQEHIIRN